MTTHISAGSPHGPLQLHCRPAPLLRWCVSGCTNVTPLRFLGWSGCCALMHVRDGGPRLLPKGATSAIHHQSRAYRVCAMLILFIMPKVMFLSRGSGPFFKRSPVPVDEFPGSTYVAADIIPVDAFPPAADQTRLIPAACRGCCP